MIRIAARYLCLLLWLMLGFSLAACYGTCH